MIQKNEEKGYKKFNHMEKTRSLVKRVKKFFSLLDENTMKGSSTNGWWVWGGRGRREKRVSQGRMFLEWWIQSSNPFNNITALGENRWIKNHSHPKRLSLSILSALEQRNVEMKSEIA